jgi:hypothetical protein
MVFTKCGTELGYCIVDIGGILFATELLWVCSVKNQSIRLNSRLRVGIRFHRLLRGTGIWPRWRRRQFAALISRPCHHVAPSHISRPVLVITSIKDRLEQWQAVCRPCFLVCGHGRIIFVVAGTRLLTVVCLLLVRAIQRRRRLATSRGAEATNINVLAVDFNFIR